MGQSPAPSANGSRAALYRAALDGTGATFTALAPAPPAKTGGTQRLLVDEAHQKLLFVTTDGRDATLQAPLLVRCDLDGTSCGTFALGPEWTGATAFPMLDAVNQRVLAATTNRVFLGRPALFVLDVW